MPKICYARKTFSSSSQALIDKSNEIIAEYEAMGFDLTLRQLYYQMVARDVIAKVVDRRDEKAWRRSVEAETRQRKELAAASSRWGEVAEFLNA